MINKIQHNIKQACLNFLKNKRQAIKDKVINSIVVTLPPKSMAGEFHISSNFPILLKNTLKLNSFESIEEFFTPNGFNFCEKCTLHKGGFMNFSLTKNLFCDIVTNFTERKKEFLFGDLLDIKKERIVLEYVSANPTGPVHLGHVRGAVFGDMLSNLLKTIGHEVLQEYYLNDFGNQCSIFMSTLRKRISQINQGNLNNIELAENEYPGEYVIDIANKVIQDISPEIVENFMNNEGSAVEEYVMQFMLTDAQQSLARLNVKHDNVVSESVVCRDYKDKVIEILSKKKLIYKKDDKTFFKTTALGDEMDRVLIRDNGIATYVCNDIGYALYKESRGFDRMINILGADHKGHVEKYLMATEAVLNETTKNEVIVTELVNFIKDGEPFKLSKRKGQMLTLDDIMEYTDNDLIRFDLVATKINTRTSIDLDTIKQQTKDNNIFYIQYAHSRCNSIVKKLSELIEKKDTNYSKENKNILDIEKLHNDPMLEDVDWSGVLIKSMYFQFAVKSFYETRDPCSLASYLKDYVSLFHSAWNNSKVKVCDEDLDVDILKNRILVLQTMQGIIVSSLELFGIQRYQSM